MPSPEVQVRPLQRLDGEPVFEEAWQAETLAIVNTLLDRNVIDPTDWAAAFGAALKKAVDEGQPDDIETYYRTALSTLEQFLADGDLLPEAEMTQRISDWREAYLNTPHGQPVSLDAAARPSDE